MNPPQTLPSSNRRAIHLYCNNERPGTGRKPQVNNNQSSRTFLPRGLLFPKHRNSDATIQKAALTTRAPRATCFTCSILTYRGDLGVQGKLCQSPKAGGQNEGDRGPPQPKHLTQALGISSRKYCQSLCMEMKAKRVLLCRDLNETSVTGLIETWRNTSAFPLHPVRVFWASSEKAQRRKHKTTPYPRNHCRIQTCQNHHLDLSKPLWPGCCVLQLAVVKLQPPSNNGTPTVKAIKAGGMSGVGSLQFYPIVGAFDLSGLRSLWPAPDSSLISQTREQRLHSGRVVRVSHTAAETGGL